MISIAKYIDAYDLAMEVRIERQVHKGAFLLLEGDTDIKRFGKFLSASCSTVNCYGRAKAITTITLLYEDGFSGAIAVVDADFDRMLGRIFEHEGIIYSKNHDLDLDWVENGAIDRYLDEVGDEEKIRTIGSVQSITESILQSLVELSLTRFAKEQLGLRVKLSNVHVDGFYDMLRFDLSAFLDEVFKDSAGKHDERLKIEVFVRERSKSAVDLMQLTNGHDFHVALGNCLQELLSSRKSPQTWGREVGMHFRLICDDLILRRTDVFWAMRKWHIDENYGLLDERLVN